MKIDWGNLLPDSRRNRKGDHIITDCPFCSSKEHFYINTEKMLRKNELGLFVGSFDCKKCGEAGNIVKLLGKLGRIDLLEGESIDFKGKLCKKIDVTSNTEEIEEIEETPNKKLPIGFKRIYSCDYLESRGFTSEDFKKYVIGTTKLISQYEDYVIIAIVEDGYVKGYMARSKLSKGEIKLINNEYKKIGSKKRYLRWSNSKNTDFSKLLFGIDEIGFQTSTCILVEGIFDKKNVDESLGLDYNLEMKCVSCFGKNISITQIRKLKNKGIKNVILVQDSDAVNTSKKHLMELKRNFINVKAGFVFGDKDLGDSSVEEIQNIFENLKDVNEYLLSFIEKKQLL